MNILENIVARILDLKQRLDRQPSYRWGTVHSVSPPRVRFEGFEEPLVDVSSKLIPITVGDVVFCVTQNRKTTIIGKSV